MINFLLCLAFISVIPVLLENFYFGSWTRNFQKQAQLSTAVETGFTNLPIRWHVTENNSSILQQSSSKFVFFHDVDAKAVPRRLDRGGLSHCFFREYERPDDVHSGLPFVGEVFATYDRSHVFVAAEGRKFCQKKFAQAHEFYSTNNRTVQFRCIFESDGSVTMSEPVHARSPFRNAFGFVPILCPIPQHLSDSLPVSGARWTRAHLTLESTMDLVTGQSFVDGKNFRPPRLSHLPICSHAWPSETDEFRISSAALQKKKHTFSVMTRISLSYLRGLGNHELLSVSEHDFRTWMEYHLAIGVEHFYIYDDSPNPKNSSLRSWCKEYMADGLITYVHYPYEDILCDDEPMTGAIMYAGQVVSTNAALRRYENETEWMGHWDVDEFLYIDGVSNATSMGMFLKQYGGNDYWDEISFQRPTYGVCTVDELENATSSNNNNNNFVAQPSSPKTIITPDRHSSNVTGVQPLVFERMLCWRKNPIPKAIYRTNSVLHFRVHKTIMVRRHDNNRTLPQIRRNPIPFALGHLAHFQQGNRTGMTFQEPSTSFEPWILPIQERMKQIK